MEAGMTNVIEFPTRPAPVTPIAAARHKRMIDPVMRNETVNDMFDRGVTPKKGDYVFYVEFRDEDNGAVVLSTGGSGAITEAVVNPDSRYVSLHYTDGTIITLSGTAKAKWYPGPAADDAR
jgi:hypothetical protein